MTSPRRLAAEVAARRLVAKGHLTARSLSFDPSSRSVSPSPAKGGMRGRATDSGPGGPTPTNPFHESNRTAVEAAHDVCGDRFPHTLLPLGGPPAPGVVRDPAS